MVLYDHFIFAVVTSAFVSSYFLHAFCTWIAEGEGEAILKIQSSVKLLEL